MDNNHATEGDFQLVAGTAWLMSHTPHREQFHLLFVDEAGQFALANLAGAGTAAANIVLLGDPQQLPQVHQASHPYGAGASVLEHLSFGRDVVPADRGVFLEESWRMHPDVCHFVSELSYGNQLRSGGDRARLLDEAGVVKAVREVENLITTVGRANIVEQLLASHRSPGSSGCASLCRHARRYGCRSPGRCRRAESSPLELHSRVACADRRIDASARLSGALLRAVAVEHQDCTQASEAEAEAISRLIREMLDGGATVTNAKRQIRMLEARDVLVVAPYNLARRCINARVPAGVRVGTVDKFQGQEAPVVFFALTCSSGEDIPRGLDFLFDRNRLNVAISRAQCLAVLVTRRGSSTRPVGRWSNGAAQRGVPVHRARGAGGASGGRASILSDLH